MAQPCPPSAASLIPQQGAPGVRAGAGPRGHRKMRVLGPLRLGDAGKWLRAPQRTRVVPSGPRHPESPLLPPAPSPLVLWGHWAVPSGVCTPGSLSLRRTGGCGCAPEQVAPPQLFISVQCHGAGLGRGFRVVPLFPPFVSVLNKEML